MSARHANGAGQFRIIDVRVPLDHPQGGPTANRLHGAKRDAVCNHHGRARVPQRVMAHAGQPERGCEPRKGDADCRLELVEGETLADRVARGSMPVQETLTIALQIVEAVEAAHDKGIIHRDLKPANIKVTPDGTVKVLDFGLAKAFFGDGTGVDLSQSPTITVAGTREGMILGTAAYMSPEQARGKPVDKRTDIWAFGCVLYELLTARSAFAGETLSDTIAAILGRQPDWRVLPDATPESVRRLLQRCLEKDQKRRLRDIGDVGIHIEDALNEPARPAAAIARVRKSQERVWWMAAMLMVVAATIVTALYFRRSPANALETLLEITTPPTTDPVSLAISPDGRKIVFVATFEGRSRLGLRSLDSVSGRALSGTDYGALPFWSPDSRSIGFFADGKLKRIDIEGGSVRELAIAPAGRGGAWNHDGTILFVPDPTGPIFRISANGGEPAPVTRLESPSQVGHRFPQFLPDGHHFLYYAAGGPEARGIYLGQLDGLETRRLLDADAAAVVASSGQLLFVRQGALFAQDFDPVRLALTGNPSPVAEQVMVDPVWNFPAVSASTAGPIVYRAGAARVSQRQFVWFDRSGKEIGEVGPDSAGVLGPAISPDGRRVALYRPVNGNVDVWLLDLARGVLSRFTSDVANDIFPIWSSDGSRIVFTSSRKGVFDFYQKPATGAGSEELLLATAQPKIPTDWSLDGRVLLYHSVDPKMSSDIWALPFDGDRKPFPVVRTNFEERDGQFSPDGKWIAYQSNESGRSEIYVQSFLGPEGKASGKWLISTNGGSQVRWRSDGTELFYIALDDRLMAVSIRFPSNGQALEAGTPVPLFATRVGGAVQYANRQQYMVSPDGQRFLMNTITGEASTSPITVILNWKPKS